MKNIFCILGVNTTTEATEGSIITTTSASITTTKTEIQTITLASGNI